MVHGVFVLVKVWGMAGNSDNITSNLRYSPAYPTRLSRDLTDRWSLINEVILQNQERFVQ